MQVRGLHLGMGMLHSHTSQPKSSLSYPIGHCREQYFPSSGQESSEKVEGEVIRSWAQQSIKGRRHELLWGCSQEHSCEGKLCKDCSHGCKYVVMNMNMSKTKLSFAALANRQTQRCVSSILMQEAASQRKCIMFTPP